MSFVSYLRYYSQLPPRDGYRYYSHVTDDEERLLPLWMRKVVDGWTESRCGLEDRTHLRV